MIRGVAEGEAGALRRLYDAQASRLFGIAMSILRDRDAAADALHDVIGPSSPVAASIARPGTT